MNRLGKILRSVSPFAACVLLSCATTSYREVYPTLTDGKYDSEFPYRGCSAQLERIAETVRMVSCVAYYKSTVYPMEAGIRLADLAAGNAEGKAVKEVILNRTSSGSATIICYSNRKVALLTCAHVVYFPDTVITYFIGEDQRSTGIIRTVDVKDRQSNYVSTLTGLRDVDILAIDRTNDIALIGQQFDIEPAFPTPVFSYPVGRAKELEWGAFVYLFGYPSGYLLVTKGIVSLSNKDRGSSFFTDAVTNQGFSGGIVLAIRDGVPNFELVGIVKTVFGRTHNFLSPSSDDGSALYDPAVPYTGKAYVRSRLELEYGVTQAVSSEAIVDFLQAHSDRLLVEGYNLRPFLDRQPPPK